MKLLKKIISTVCAVGMLATVASSMFVAHAAEKPTFKISVENYDKDAGTGTFVYSVKGLQSPGVTSDPTCVVFKMAQLNTKYDSNVFDTTLWNARNFNKNVSKSGKFASVGSWSLAKYDMASNIMPGVWNSSGPSDGESLGINGSNLADEHEIMRLNFKLDTSKLPTTVELGDVLFIVEDWDDDWATVVGTNKFGNASGDAKEMNYEFPKIAGIEFKVPDNAGATADSSAILNVKPSDVGGTGDVWASADGSENAVAGLANFTPSAATSTIEWTISATPVGGEATQYTKAFDLGASIDAAATIGLIVNYNTAEYSSVSIVSGALK